MIGRLGRPGQARRERRFVPAGFGATSGSSASSVASEAGASVVEASAAVAASPVVASSAALALVARVALEPGLASDVADVVAALCERLVSGAVAASGAGGAV